MCVIQDILVLLQNDVLKGMIFLCVHDNYVRFYIKIFTFYRKKLHECSVMMF